MGKLKKIPPRLLITIKKKEKKKGISYQNMDFIKFLLSSMAGYDTHGGCVSYT